MEVAGDRIAEGLKNESGEPLSCGEEAEVTVRTDPSVDVDPVTNVAEHSSSDSAFVGALASGGGFVFSRLSDATHRDFCFLDSTLR